MAHGCVACLSHAVYSKGASGITASLLTLREQNLGKAGGMPPCALMKCQDILYHGLCVRAAQSPCSSVRERGGRITFDGTALVKAGKGSPPPTSGLGDGVSA